MEQRIDVGATLSRVFTLYREQAGILLPAAALLYLLPAIATIALGSGAAGLGLVATLLALVVQYWYQGVVVRAVVDMEDGRRDFSMGDLFGATAPFIWPLFLAGLLAGIGIAIGLILLIVPGLILLTWWALIAPAIVLEGTGVGGAFGRSRELVRGHGWQVFGIIVVLGIVQVVVGILLAIVAVAISDGRVADALGTYVGSVLVAPLSALAATVVYLRLRKIKGQGDVREGVAREATYGGGFAAPQAEDPRTPSGDPAPTSVAPRRGPSPRRPPRRPRRRRTSRPQLRPAGAARGAAGVGRPRRPPPRRDRPSPRSRPSRPPRARGPAAAAAEPARRRRGAAEPLRALARPPPGGPHHEPVRGGADEHLDPARRDLHERHDAAAVERDGAHAPPGARRSDRRGRSGAAHGSPASSPCVAPSRPGKAGACGRTTSPPSGSATWPAPRDGARSSACSSTSTPASSGRSRRGRRRSAPSWTGPIASSGRPRRAWATQERLALRADLERVEAELDGTPATGGARGLAVFASSQAGLFAALRLPVAVDHEPVVADTPYLEPLTSLADGEQWAVLLVNRSFARLLVGGRDTLEELALVESDVHGRHDQGGWSQARYQRSVEHDVHEHLKAVAETAARLLRPRRPAGLVLGAPEETRHAAEAALPSDLRGLVAGHMTVDVEHASADEVRAAAAEVIDRVGHEREDRLLARLREGLARRDDGRASAGTGRHAAGAHRAARRGAPARRRRPGARRRVPAVRAARRRRHPHLPRGRGAHPGPRGRAPRRRRPRARAGRRRRVAARATGPRPPRARRRRPALLTPEDPHEQPHPRRRPARPDPAGRPRPRPARRPERARPGPGAAPGPRAPTRPRAAAGRPDDPPARRADDAVADARRDASSRRGFGRSSRPTFATARPSTRTMSAVKSLLPRSSDDPTP